MNEEPEIAVASRHVSGGTWVVEVAGEIDLHSGRHLAQELDELLEAGASRFAVDLARVSYLDSSGLRILMEYRQRAVEGRGGLVLVGTSARAAKVVKLTGLGDRLPTFGTVEEAAAALDAEE